MKRMLCAIFGLAFGCGQPPGGSEVPDSILAEVQPACDQKYLWVSDAVSPFVRG